MPDIVLNTTFNNPLLPVVDLPDLVVFRDDFNRADALELGVTPVGGRPWVLYKTNPAAGSAQAKIVGGKAGVGSTSTERAFATIDTDRSDGILRAVFGGPLLTSAVHLAFRMVDASNMLFLTASGSNGIGKYALYNRIAASGKPIKEATSAVPVTGDVIEIETLGTSVKVRVNGSQIFDEVITEFQTAKLVGFGGNVVASTTRDIFAFWDDISFVVPR